MKFISWNVNGLRAVIGKGFSESIEALDADFICLQETKLQEANLTELSSISPPLPTFPHCYWNHAEKKGLKRRNLMIQKSYNLFENTLIGSVIYNMLDIESYIEFKNKQDATVKKAISQFE